MMSIEEKSTPVEVWLSKANIGITCTVVYEDETTDPRDIDSTSMRGAQREITGWLITRGYKPVSRWTTEAEHDGEDLETSRVFKLASQ